jgi:hypothetical protein
MLTVQRVRQAYRTIRLRPASDVYFDAQEGACCPAIAVCLAEGRLMPTAVKTAMAPAEIAEALHVPTLYLCAFVDSLNRWHTTGWGKEAAFCEGRFPKHDDPALQIMRRGWHAGTRVGTALFGSLDRRRRRRPPRRRCA